MSIGKENFCKGVDPFNLAETDQIAVTVTTCVGQATASGPKVALRIRKPISRRSEVVAVDMGGGKSSSNITKNLSPTITCTHGGEPVIGTIDASIYKKNGFQDNNKYIIEKKARKDNMDKNEVKESLLAAIGNGKDVLGVINLTESLLKLVLAGTMTIEEAIGALSELRNSLVRSNDVVETSDDDEEEMCVVRRLTPTETARLQGFPDDYTKIDGEETADAPQFKAHGNSWATPCANFVSTRIEMELRRLGYEGTINYATCCSGIEAHSVSVRNLDWKSLFFSEIEPFPCRVLAAHYPTTPNLGDMTQIHFDAKKGVITNSHVEGEEYSLPSCFKEAPIQEIPFKIGDLQVFSGGTPCQSISVAGKREGMAEGSGTRSSLAFHYQRIIDESKPTFTIWENVPGAFSSNGGADFIWFVNKCAESGYSMAWRVLDAQWMMTEEFPRAVPQRRRRIWLVGFKGNDWRIPARIVFELNKELTSNPPTRVPLLGFKTLNKEGLEEQEAKPEVAEAAPHSDSNLMGLVMESDDGRKELLKVSKMIDFSEMPNESDFSKVPMASIFEFARKIGEPGYIGSVFRTDKKKKPVVVDSTMDLFSMLDAPKDASTEEKKDEPVGESDEWVGAEKITPAILENIGNSGILANGRICTMNCHEWTSGIQLSPAKYNAWEEFVKHKEWLKANDLLPEAYDETVCGLSDVLEDDPDEKYNLSWRACFGILKRAETRGKELPEALAIALVCTIRENAGIVKWVALNGRDTKKKDTDLSEKESAMLCFEKFISPVAKFEEVEAVAPNKNAEAEEELESEGMDTGIDPDGGVVLDDDGNPILEDEGYESFGSTFASPAPAIEKEKMPDLPNGVINVSGGETAATLIASGDAAVGTTQDANVIALKK